MIYINSIYVTNWGMCEGLGPISLTLTYIEDLLTSGRKASNRQVRVFVAHRDVECASGCDVRISVVIAYRGVTPEFVETTFERL